MKRRALAVITLALTFCLSSLAWAEDDASASSEARPRMDLVFVIDATGSMGDEIDVIKKEVWTIANEVMTGDPAPDVRLGLVLYRDKSDAKLVEVTGLTRDVDAVHGQLMAAQAMGGGDNPEHVGKGLHTALDFDWEIEEGVARKIYLVGDAPAKAYEDHSLESALGRARQQGVRINTIGGSGIESGGGRGQFAMIAAQTGGAFEALTYFAVVEEPDGRKKSVLYHDGKTYEAEGEISEEEWKKGGAALVAEYDMEEASGETRRKARRAPKKNNLDSLVKEDMKAEAASMGVSY